MPDSATILVLEDDAFIAMSIAETLSAAGYATRVVGSLEEAESALSGDRIDAATLDFRIGGGDCSAFVDLLESRGVPFIFCTGSMEAEVREQFATEAIVLCKPFRDIDLLDAVASTLRPGQAERPAGQSASLPAE